MRPRFYELFKKHNVDLLLAPTTVSLPMHASPTNHQTTTVNGKEISIFENDRNSTPGAVAGLPGITIPIGRSIENLPIGINLDGPRNADEQFLSDVEIIETLV
ncbi:amidase family protein [Alteromonas oceanisediminis]|uniref:amidase family protein n=1 Tax=Alteromonas oceanisediminis TaxID=2836180 RepID=UPI001BD92DD1|nr:amidase family protein [Alteromonas oceanisediminis]MBT0588030.1 hypothetical protein [Alteromonas oceanisediminis]